MSEAEQLAELLKVYFRLKDSEVKGWALSNEWIAVTEKIKSEIFKLSGVKNV